MIRLHPDKMRFVDDCALGDPHLIHAIELSDERSSRQFATVWVKGKHTGPRANKAVAAFAARHGLTDHHDAATYHRGDHPETARLAHGWLTHFHIDLPAPPTWADVERFAADMPRDMLADLRVCFGLAVASAGACTFAREEVPA